MGKRSKAAFLAWIVLSTSLIVWGGIRLQQIQNTNDRNIRITACRAVKASNNALDEFLTSRVSKVDPEGQRFVKDLISDHAKVYAKCLDHVDG